MPNRFEVYRPQEIDPPLEKYAGFAREKRARLGNLAARYATWGEWQGTAETIRYFGLDIPHLVSASNEQKERLQGIQALKFSGGYHYPHKFDNLSPEVQFQQAKHAAMLVKHLLHDRQWKGADLLTIGSVSSTPEINDMVVELLKSSGLKIDKTLFYGMACVGASAAFADALRDEQYRNAKVITIGIESLSGSTVHNDDYLTQLLFGNAASGLAYIPGVDVEHIAGKIIVEHDEFGVIKLPPPYSLPSEDDSIDPPPWYEVRPSEDGQPYFRVTDKGKFIVMHPSQGKHAEVYGSRNLRYFMDRGPKPIDDVLTQLAQEMGTDMAFNPALVHHPNALIHKGIGKQVVKRANRLGFHFDQERDFPWRMEKLGINNVSAATIFITLVEMINNGEIAFDVFTPMLGFAVGSACSGDIIRFKRKR